MPLPGSARIAGIRTGLGTNNNSLSRMAHDAMY